MWGAGAVIDGKRLAAWYNFQAPAYHLWRDQYDGALVRQVSLMLVEADGDDPRRVLDVGCGSGLFTIGLASLHRAWSFEGLDASSGLLKIARRQAARRSLGNVALVEGDVAAMPHAAEQFDIVIAGGLFPNLNDHAAAIREVWRVLRPGGHFIVVEFDRAALTVAGRLFFNGMIAAYRAVSFVFRRFRFAPRWDIQTSTIDGGRFERSLIDGGFERPRVLRRDDHLFFHARKRVS
jgi:ubiquinone/menaquinone biosynthesis C-methylase UbiE